MMSDLNMIHCDFKCPICDQYMHPPIYMCANGHGLCNDCRTKIKAKNTPCPLYTQSSIAATCTDCYRCPPMESIHAKILFPCRYSKEGCLVETTNIEKHEDRCKYNTTRCCPLAVNPCDWKGNFADMPKHLDEKHTDLIIKNNKNTFYFNLKPPSSTIKVKERFVEKYNYIFHVVFVQNSDYVGIIVQCVGCDEDAAKFAYKIEIRNDDKTKVLAITEGCEEFENLTVAFNKEKGFSISHRKLQHFYNPFPKAALQILKLEYETCSSSDEEVLC